MAVPVFSDARRRARIGRRHLLATGVRTDDVPAVADALVALHSSDPVSVYLSVTARMRQPTLSAVGAALYPVSPARLIRHHAMRRTLWVMTPEVARAAHAACTTGLVRPQTERTAAMLAAGGLPDPHAWLHTAKQDLLAALRQRGEASTRELGAAVPTAAMPVELAPGTAFAATQGAHTRVMLLLGFDGAVLRTRPAGSWINGQYRWVPAESVLPGGFDPADPAAARAELTARWLRTFGPGTTADLRWWLGATAAAVRDALRSIDAQPVALADGSGWVLLEDAADREAPIDDEPWVALLPGLDPTTMGWQDRRFYLGTHGPELFDRNGNAGPTIWADGRVIGGWVQRSDGTIATEVLEPVGAATLRAVAAAAARLRELLGDDRFNVRFPSPLSARLRRG